MAEDNVKHIHIEDADEAEEQKTESPEAEETAADEYAALKLKNRSLNAT